MSERQHRENGGQENRAACPLAQRFRRAGHSGRGQNAGTQPCHLKLRRSRPAAHHDRSVRGIGCHAGFWRHIARRCEPERPPPGIRCGVHEIFLVAREGSHSDRAEVVIHDLDRPLDQQLPDGVDIVHCLGNAAWRVKNLRGALAVARRAKLKLQVLGGRRLMFSMGLKVSLDRHGRFHAMVGDATKADVLSASRGLVFPVTWHEPFGWR